MEQTMTHTKVVYLLSVGVGQVREITEDEVMVEGRKHFPRPMCRTDRARADRLLALSEAVQEATALWKEQQPVRVTRAEIVLEDPVSYRETVTCG